MKKHILSIVLIIAISFLILSILPTASYAEDQSIVPAQKEGFVLSDTIMPSVKENGFIGDIGAANPSAITINSAEELYIRINDNLNENFVLTSNIDLSNYNNGVWTPIGSASTPFTGALDGQGFTISNMNIPTSSDTQYAGLFAYTSNCTIKNLGIIIKSKSQISGHSNSTTAWAGGLAAYADNSITIQNCFIKGDVSVIADASSAYPNAGGLVGESGNSLFISDSYVEGDVYASARYSSTGVGGFAGLAAKVSINNSFKKGDVTGESRYTNYAGGLIGYSFYLSGYMGTIKNSFCIGDITASTTSTDSILGNSNYAAGIIASGRGVKIENCFTDCTINVTHALSGYGAGAYAGGLIASSVDAPLTIDNCFTLGAINVNANEHCTAYAGGLAAYCKTLASPNVCVNNSYSVGDINVNSATNLAYAGGLLGYIKITQRYNPIDLIFANSHAIGDITAKSLHASSYVGGICGYYTDYYASECGNTIVFDNNYVSGYISASGKNTSYAGGIMGYSDSCLNFLSPNYYFFCDKAIGYCLTEDITNPEHAQSSLRPSGIYKNRHIPLVKAEGYPDYPVSPESNNSAYRAELMAWMEGSGYRPMFDDYLEMYTWEELLNIPVNVPVQGSDGKTYLLSNNELTVGQMMAYIVFLEHLQTFSADMNDNILSSIKEEHSAEAYITAYEQIMNAYYRLLEFEKTLNNREEFFKTLGYSMLADVVIDMVPEIPGGGLTFKFAGNLKRLSVDELDEENRNNPLYYAISGGDSTYYDENLQEAVDLYKTGMDAGHAAYKAVIEGESGAGVDLLFDCFLKYMNRSDNEFMRNTALFMSETKSTVDAISLLYNNPTLACVTIPMQLTNNYLEKAKGLFSQTEKIDAGWFILSLYHLNRNNDALLSSMIDVNNYEILILSPDNPNNWSYDESDVIAEALLHSYEIKYYYGDGGYLTFPTFEKKVIMTRAASMLSQVSEYDCYELEIAMLSYLLAELNRQNGIAGITRTLHVSASDNMAGNVSGGGEYEDDTLVTITALPKTNCLFVGWRDQKNQEIISTDTEYSFRIYEDLDLTAIFEAIPPELYTVSVINGTGSGNFPAGAAVGITANPPADGMVFDKWTSTDGVTFTNANNATTTFIMLPKALTVTAIYKTAAKYNLTVIGGSGTGQYAKNDIVIATANTPIDGMRFKEWSAAGLTNPVYNENPLSITMPGNSVTLSAVFEDIQEDLQGDFNSNGIIDFSDLTILLHAYGTKSNHANFDGTKDMNGDGIIDIYDFVWLAKQI